MTTKALFVKLEAKPGKEDEVAKFLRDGQGLVAQEPATTAWFGIRLGPKQSMPIGSRPRKGSIRICPPSSTSSRDLSIQMPRILDARLAVNGGKETFFIWPVKERAPLRDRDKPRQGVVTNRLNLFRNGGWLHCLVR